MCPLLGGVRPQGYRISPGLVRGLARRADHNGEVGVDARVARDLRVEGARQDVVLSRQTDSQFPVKTDSQSVDKYVRQFVSESDRQSVSQ